MTTIKNLCANILHHISRYMRCPKDPRLDFLKKAGYKENMTNFIYGSNIKHGTLFIGFSAGCTYCDVYGTEAIKVAKRCLLSKLQYAHIPEYLNIKNRMKFLKIIACDIFNINFKDLQYCCEIKKNNVYSGIYTGVCIVKNMNMSDMQDIPDMQDMLDIAI